MGHDPFGDDETTPVMPPSPRRRRRNIHEQRWLIARPGKPGYEYVTGPAGEPPVCEPCEKTPAPAPNPTFVGERECGGCKSRFLPED